MPGISWRAMDQAWIDRNPLAVEHGEVIRYNGRVGRVFGICPVPGGLSFTVAHPGNIKRRTTPIVVPYDDDCQVARRLSDPSVTVQPSPPSERQIA